MGQSASAVLALADTLRDGVDGPESLCFVTRSVVWSRPIVRSHCLLHSDAHLAVDSRTGLSPRDGSGRRFQRQNLNRSLCACDPVVICKVVARLLDLCSGGSDLAGT